MRYTLIFVFTEDMEKVLLAYKNRGPYPNKHNGVGGKVEIGEDICGGAYRELKEETGLTLDDVSPLVPLVGLVFPDGVLLSVFYTKIKEGKNFIQCEDEPLHWHIVDYNLNVTDKDLAGDGNIPYFLHLARKMEGKV